MNEYQSLLKDIKNKNFLPIYFLQGTESYFIDKIIESLENEILQEDQKAFNLHIFYGKEVDIENVISVAQQFPFGSEKQLVIVKEAQHLPLNKEKESEILENYIHKLQATTILAFAYKNAKLDGRKSLPKSLKKIKSLFQLDAPKEFQLDSWIQNIAASKNLKLEPKSLYLLNESIGNSLSTVDNQLEKLKDILGENVTVTPNDIEKHIGISKDFNTFELTKALAFRDEKKAFRIVNYFENNPKSHPLVLTTGAITNFYLRLLKIHAANNPSPQNIMAIAGVPFAAVTEYQNAIKNYSMKDVSYVLELLLEMDIKSKGVNNVSVNDSELLKEFVFKTLHNIPSRKK